MDFSHMSPKTLFVCKDTRITVNPKSVLKINRIASNLVTFLGVKQLLTFCDNGSDDGRLSCV